MFTNLKQKVYIFYLSHRFITTAKLSPDNKVHNTLTDLWQEKMFRGTLVDLNRFDSQVCCSSSQCIWLVRRNRTTLTKWTKHRFRIFIVLKPRPIITPVALKFTNSLLVIGSVFGIVILIAPRVPSFLILAESFFLPFLFEDYCW